MISESLNRLQWLCANISPLLEAIPEDEFSSKPAADKWSKKEILGHLIDSAANNHHRFVRMQFDDNYSITSYDQNKWVIYSYHQLADKQELIIMWKTYNLFLTSLMGNVADDMLNRKASTGDGRTVTLAWLFNDYVAHAEHHLKQIVSY
ncbi:MAG: DinB family protein [Sphingobacteriales bacterium]|nr:MAG: DinB family protein [Sphingobacteriales bacterium]